MRLELRPVNGAPIRSGVVEDVATRGDHVYARLRCALFGGPAHARLVARLLIHFFDPTCSSTPLAVASGSLGTDARGNGSVEVVLRVEDVPHAARRGAHGMRWELLRDGEPLYRTANVVVTLD